ncbi:MAG: ABC transporter permease [Ectothiorhodospiraceae bacterium]|nr:ABC transporter permease [Ectothiorhodospiraceae bacterium]
MKRSTRIRLWVIAGLVGGLEVLCRTEVIGRFTMIPPSEMILGLVRIVRQGDMNADIVATLGNVAVALVSAIVVGFLVGALLFVLPRVRRVIDPLLATYYAIPIFVFYPLLIVLLGLNRFPQIAIGFMLAVVAMIVNTLNGFDRVPQSLLKTARVYRMGRVRTTFLVILPCAMLYIFTGLKLAVAYSFIGVIAAEFILSGEGLGYEISFAYNNFENATMYPLIVLVIGLSALINMVLYAWEKKYLQRQTER